MFDTADRAALRAMYFQAWGRARAHLPLTPLESQIAAVVDDHPEYHQALADDASRDIDFDAGGRESNPFLHMGLHLALRDQIATDRPSGIRSVFQRIVQRSPSAHDAEHRAVECLMQTLREAHLRGAPPDEALYLARLQRTADAAGSGSS